jgi:two-component system chemotaxis response regulator CheB
MPGKAFALNAHCEQVSLTEVAAAILHFASLDETEMRKVNYERR